MSMQNIEIAAMLTQLADLLEIEGENPFRVRAYRNAARLVETLPHSVAAMIEAGEDLSELPGIGKALANKMQEMVATGHLTALEKEEKHIPATLSDLLKVPGLGPKRVHSIYERLSIRTLADLTRAVETGRLRELPGFGEKTEAMVRQYLQNRHPGTQRALRATVEQLVAPLLDRLGGAPGVKQVTVAGSYRRQVETLGDVDILVASSESSEVSRLLVESDDVAEVLARGKTKSSVVLRSGLQVDLRVVPESSYGAALHYFTGSKAHNIAIRTRGLQAGLKINEYGVFRGDLQVGGQDETDVFKAVGLPFIEPELRENRGEIEAAEKNLLPRLVTLADLRGDFQSHTTATDGRDDLTAMAHAAQARGYEYLAVTDHSKRMTMVHGLNATRLARQLRDIDKLNATFERFRLLKSIEVDILDDGSLDLSDDILRELDVVIAAVHSRLTLSRDRQTERILRAMDNPYVTILAHPTGRLINQRPPMDIDLERLLKAAKERGCVVELNAQPTRLDLDAIACRMAHDLGVKVALSSDAHSAVELEVMRHGIAQARRGWLTAEDVINSRSWKDLKPLLKRV
jgi:DNA polymerase (family 10)